MNTLLINYPAPPIDAIMPATAQDTILWISVVIVLLCFGIAVRMSAKYGTLLPVLFLVAGFCTIPLEGLTTHLGHAWHPEIGQYVLFKSNDRAIPIYIAIMYIFYFGGVYMAVFPKIIGNSFTTAYVWKSYFLTCLLSYLIEIVPVHLGLWIYYDHQALWVWRGGMPLFWTFMNVLSIFVPITLIKVFYPMLTGLRQLLVIPLSLVGAVIGSFGAGLPVYIVANSSAGPLWVNVAGLASVALALSFIYVCSKVLSGEKVA